MKVEVDGILAATLPPPGYDGDLDVWLGAWMEALLAAASTTSHDVARRGRTVGVELAPDPEGLPGRVAVTVPGAVDWPVESYCDRIPEEVEVAWDAAPTLATRPQPALLRRWTWRAELEEVRHEGGYLVAVYTLTRPQAAGCRHGRKA